MSWSEAFAAAMKLGKEGDDMVADFVEKQQQRKEKKMLKKMQGGTEEDNNDSDDGGGGAFKQPRALALFKSKSPAPVHSVAAASHALTSPESGAGKRKRNSAEESDLITKKSNSSSTGERDMVFVLSKQICRQWLKFAFLSGNKCSTICKYTKQSETSSANTDITSSTASITGVATGELGQCGRMHYLPAENTAAFLYKDYSFMGLPVASRKSILAAVEVNKGKHTMSAVVAPVDAPKEPLDSGESALETEEKDGDKVDKETPSKRKRHNPNKNKNRRLKRS